MRPGIHNARVLSAARSALLSLTAAGVKAISLKNVWNGARRNGNVLGETGQARTANGIVSVVDVYFGVRN